MSLGVEEGESAVTELPILLYTMPEGAVNVNAALKDETLWLTQLAMAELLGVQKAARAHLFRSARVTGGRDRQRRFLI